MFLNEINKIVQVVETNMDGTSGALYAIFLNNNDCRWFNNFS